MIQSAGATSEQGRVSSGGEDLKGCWEVGARGSPIFRSKVRMMQMAAGEKQPGEALERLEECKECSVALDA